MGLATPAESVKVKLSFWHGIDEMVICIDAPGLSVPLPGEKLALPRLSLADHFILPGEPAPSVRVTVQDQVELPLQLFVLRLVGETDHVVGSTVGDGVGEGVGVCDGVSVGDGGIDVGVGDGVGVGVLPESSVSVTGIVTPPPFELIVILALLLPACRLRLFVSIVTWIFCGTPPGCTLPLERLSESQPAPLVLACHCKASVPWLPIVSVFVTCCPGVSCPKARFDGFTINCACFVATGGPTRI